MINSLEFKLEDFFPIYTSIDEDVIDNNLAPLYNSVILKKEFDDSRSILNEPKPNRGEQLKHQAFMSRFMSPYTPYEKMIVFHGLGSGKSATLFGVAEYAKLVKAGELSNNKIIVLTRNPTLRRGLMNELTCVVTAGKYEPPIRDEVTKELLSKKAQRNRAEKKINVEYEVLTFTMFVKQIYNKTNEQLKMEYSNRYIIIDEAHNIKLQPEKKKIKDEDDIISLQLQTLNISNYKEIHRLLHNVVGCKVLLLTATPMKDQPSEICNILNLILPMNKQLDRKEFNKQFFEGEEFKDDQKEYFKSLLRSHVSYLRASSTDISIINKGVISEEFNYMKTYSLPMEQEQSEKYSQEYLKDSKKYKDVSSNDEIEEEDEEDSGKGLWLKSRQASMFVSFDEDEKLNTLIKQDGNIFRPTARLINYLREEGDDMESMLTQLKKVSIKFWFIVSEIFKYPTQKFFIYSNIVKGAGALLLGAILQVFNMEHAPILAGKEGTEYCQTTKQEETSIPLTKKENRILVLTGSTLSATQLDVMINDVFNRPENKNGEYIRVIIGSHIVGEGVSFKHIRRMYVLTPSWNSATTDQAIGRAIRFKSHQDLPPNERDVSVFRVVAEPEEDLLSKRKIESIDMRMYKISEDKDIKIKQVERLLKESAIDCALNRSRNLLQSDKPNTRECDYMDCEYKCDLVDERYYHANWVGDRIVDTYNLYYAYKEINIVKNAVKEAFQYKFAYDFEELYSKIENDVRNIPAIVLARALDSMIKNNDLVVNKLGINNYIREDRNMFFLVDDPLSPSIFTNYYYSANPVPENALGTFNNILLYYQYDKIENVLTSLIKYQDNEEVLENIFKNISTILIQKIIEIFFIAKLNGSDVNIELQDYIVTKYSPFIRKVNGNYILNIDKNLPTRILYEDESKWVDLSTESVEEMKDIEEGKVSELKENDFGIYAIISNKYGGKDEYKNLKLVETKRKTSGGTICSTSPYILKTLIGLYYDVMKKSISKGLTPPILGTKTKFTLTKLKEMKQYSTLIDNLNQRVYIRKMIEILMNVDSDEFKEFVDKLNAKEKKKITKIIEKNIIEENDYEDIIKLIDKEDLINTFGTISLEEEIEDEVDSEMKALTEDEMNYIGNMLNKSAADICTGLKEWFIDNNLYVRE